VLAGAAVVRSNLNLGTGQSSRWQQMRCRPRALQHHHGATPSDQCLNDAGKYRDAQPAGDAYSRPLPLEVETSPERAQEVERVALT
jgi:hypothetical protein